MAELTTRRCGPEFLAKRDGPCKGCGKTIRGGEDYARVVDRVGTMHALCAKNYCAILEEHAEEGE